MSRGTALREPRRTTSRSCRTRRSFTCSASGRSPISSRNKVPWLAASNQPAWDCEAPVKAPAWWPKSSASASDSVNAPQFTATKGPVRPLCSWTRRAASSLPVPVSPVIRTGTSLRASCPSRSNTARDFASANMAAVAFTAEAPDCGRVGACPGNAVEFMSLPKARRDWRGLQAVSCLPTKRTTRLSHVIMTKRFARVTDL